MLAPVTDRALTLALQTQAQETTFLVQFVLKMRFLVSECGVQLKACSGPTVDEGSTARWA
eukprot:2357514-Rhodomonas_salina.1